ncbi:DUF962 domain-containing protein [Thalassotalea sp. ND16A]|uniref:DUF962 domain-containing protein n=1 Tax=Thalassotalea sp. ND16A TaxID=1535422 RepID=UPI00051A11EC|nr:DUF962 domain-containing protein [Thalassotalea sp. ND16A]KGJ90545.1 hypothetical protein ND16A_1941 [Thalassotalea sp. ND16A]
MSDKQYQSFKQFYPFYLSQHRNAVCRALHYLGSVLVLMMLAYATYSQQYLLLWILAVIGDWVMLFDFLTGKKHH